MGRPKHNFVRQFTFSVNAEIVKVIQKSGMNPADWLREAAQMRMEQENSEDTPLGAVQRQLKSLQKHVDELTAELKNVKHELGKSHITLIGAESQLVDVRKLVAFVRQNQLDLSGLLGQMDKNFSHAVNQLGPSLLVLLSQQLRDLIQVEIVKNKEKESLPKPRLPTPPRYGL